MKDVQEQRGRRGYEGQNVANSRDVRRCFELWVGESFNSLSRRAGASKKREAASPDLNRALQSRLRGMRPSTDCWRIAILGNNLSLSQRDGRDADAAV